VTKNGVKNRIEALDCVGVTIFFAQLNIRDWIRALICLNFVFKKLSKILKFDMNYRQNKTSYFFIDNKKKPIKCVEMFIHVLI
jgi:hypothetical protein